MLSFTQRQNLDVAALAVAGVISLQAATSFSIRFKRSPVPMHFVGAIAGLFGLAYSVLRMCYWFTGATAPLSCSTLLIVSGMLQNVSVALALLHLLLRADAVNRINPQWKRWRWIGIFFTLLNAAAFIMYLLLRKVTEYRGC
jgi:hypothetical protein